MHFNARVWAIMFFAVSFAVEQVAAQEVEQPAHGEATESVAHDEQHEAEHEAHGEDPGHSSHHLNDVAVFLGATDEPGHPTEFTWGLDYKRRVAERWAVGGLFDYAGGLRNAILAASVTWLPIGNLALTAAPGVEFHRGRGSSEDCNCPHALKSDGGGDGEVDENATYFVFRVGVGWGFTIGDSYAIEPQVNLDLVEGEKVWVYGLNFIYAW